ncbi:MAG: hypothetical protein DMD55_17450, partial [Gemmatimonadetes bacterium]
FFRIPADGSRSLAYLPFYELLEASSILPDGRKVSDLAWVNYRTEEAIFTSDRVSNPRLEIPPRLLFPEDVDDSAAPGSPPPMRRTSLERSVRFAGYGVLGLVAAAVLFNVYRARASGPGETVASEREAAASPRDLVDRTADTVALAVGAFELRARLFDSRRMACPDLARGLVDLEERWTSYNVARKADAAGLDSAGAARDRSLYADVDAAERLFERSQCPRP